MIEIIMLSTMISFSGPSEQKCRAFEEIIEYKQLEYKYNKAECGPIDLEGNYICVHYGGPKKKILSRTLVGLCDDSVVRWSMRP